MSLKERMSKMGTGVTVHWMIPAEDGPIHSGGLTVNTPEGSVQAGMPGTYTVACDPKERFKEDFSASGETCHVTCPLCMKHPLFAKKYEPHPRHKRYEDIPAHVREILESAGE